MRQGHQVSIAHTYCKPHQTCEGMSDSLSKCKCGTQKQLSLYAVGKPLVQFPQFTSWNGASFFYVLRALQSRVHTLWGDIVWIQSWGMETHWMAHLFPYWVVCQFVSKRNSKRINQIMPMWLHSWEHWEVLLGLCLFTVCVQSVCPPTENPLLSICAVWFILLSW